MLVVAYQPCLWLAAGASLCLRAIRLNSEIWHEVACRIAPVYDCSQRKTGLSANGGLGPFFGTGRTSLGACIVCTQEPSLNWSSTCRPPARSALKFRRCCSLEPTRLLSEAARVHYPCRRRCSGPAARSARAEAGDAGDRVPQRRSERD